MSERARRVVPVLCANAGASLAALTMVLWSGLPVPALVPLSVLAGTAGYLLGGALGRAALRAVDRARLAPPGRLAYRLAALPPAEADHAGGKARALARLARAGHPVPAAFVLLPRAFDGDELTADGRETLADLLARLGRGPFAVRSSALAEDSPTASFAGAFETALDVDAPDVPGAVRRVRASRHAPRVNSYADARGVADGGEVAVIVQRMVPAQLSGVLFTADPLTGDLDRMHGNLVAGQGEALVSGTSDAAPFTFHRPDGAYAGPPELASTAARLHDAADRIESLFDGVAQDIEWAAADGRVYILQSRPITTMTGWNPVTAERNDSLTGTCLWSATNLSEANPEPQTPLTISAVAYQQNHGGPSMKVRGREMAGTIGGRPYANLSVQLSAQGPRALADPRAAYRKLEALWGALPDAVPVPMLPVSRADWREEGPRLLGTVVRLALHRLRLRRFLATSPAACRELTGRVEACATPADLLRLWTAEVFPASLRSFWAVIAATGNQADPIEAELRQLTGTDDAAVLLANVAGLAGDLESLGPAAGLQQVLAGTLSREEYLERFGHRGHNEVELAWPRPAEDPGWLDRALAAAASTDVQGLQERQQAAFRAALDRLRTDQPRHAPALERRLRQRAVRAARRERVRSEAVRWTGLNRRFALRAGHLLGIGEDVFWLTLPELLDALAGHTGAYAHVGVRRRVLERYRSLPPLPGFIVGRFDPFEWASRDDRRTTYFVAGADAGPAPSDAAGVLRGAPGSSGVVEGIVRRLDRIEDAESLQPGEVLVTPLTNIGWTPVFPRAAAIVTDIGAPLSHAAIVARELGIPAVVGCGDATRRLATGARVRVDGARGTVELLTP